MKRLALVGWLVAASLATAAVAPQRIELRPHAHLNVPPEATTAAAGGPGVVAVEQVKSTVVIQYTGGAPCGRGPDPDPIAPPGRGGSSGSDGMSVWLPAGVAAGAVGGIALLGIFLLRRSRV